MRYFIFLFITLLAFSCNESDDDTPSGTTEEPTPQSTVAFTLANAGQAYGKDLIVDAQDNFYYTSLYQGNITGKPFTSVGIIDNYFAKHDSDGELIWERSFGGAGSITVAHGIETDASNNVYLTGYFGAETADDGRTIDFGNGITTTSQSGYDAFVAKYDAEGIAQWAFGLGNHTATSEERTWDMAVDASGAIYVSGAFSGTVDFNPLGGSKEASTSGIGHFLAKYDSDGQNDWVIVMEANLTNVFTEGYTTIDTDSNGDVVLAGVYRNALSVGGQTVQSAGQTDIFLAKFSASDGQMAWVKSFGGGSMDIVSPGAMRVDAQGQPHLTGRFAGTSNFGGTTLVSNSAGNTFVVTCDVSGNTRWAIAHTSNSGLDGGHRIAFDAQNNVYVAGWFRGSATFDLAGSIQRTSVGTNNAGDVFLAKYNPMGDLSWVQHFGAPVSGAENLSICAGLGVDSGGNSVITGKFYGANADYDPDPDNTLMLSSEGQDDCFVVKYDSEGTLYKY